MVLVNRRVVLNGIGAAGTLLTPGCLAGGSEGGTISPRDEPENIPDGSRCDDEEFERHPTVYDEDDVHWGDLENFSLRADGVSFEYGERVSISLTYTGSETGTTGNKHTYNVELYTGTGWQEVRGTSGEAIGYSDEAVTHDPGDGFTWEIELTEEGISEASIHGGKLRVCPRLTSGRYRFVHPGPVEDGALAIAFDLRRGTSMPAASGDGFTRVVTV